MAALLQAHPRGWLLEEGHLVRQGTSNHWHFADSDENRLRLASYWTATMFLLDMAWDLNQVYDALQRLPQRSWDACQQNLKLIFEQNPQSYKDRMMRAVKVLFGENQRFVPLVGSHFTQEDVRARQSDTEEYHDPDKLDPP